MAPHYNSDEHDNLDHELEEEEEELQEAEDELEEEEEELQEAEDELEEEEEELRGYKKYKRFKIPGQHPPLPPLPPDAPHAPPPVAPLPPMPPLSRRHRQPRRHQKNITFRGVDSVVYNEFSSKMRQLNLNLGDALTKLMKDVLKDTSGEFPSLSTKSLTLMKLPRAHIEHHDRLTISKKDLIEANAHFRFEHIKELTFDSSVDRDTFMTYVRYIEHCKVVRIPSILPKLLIYSKVNRCGDIEIYEPEFDPKPSDTE